MVDARYNDFCNARPCPTDASLADLLPKADFSDAYRIVVAEPLMDAPAAVERVLGRTPGWIAGLMKLRNTLVAPFGLKPGPDISDSGTPGRPLVRFPVISETPERVVLGMDDKHLDFRLAIDVGAVDAERRSIVLTTLVRTRNPGGRFYLSAIMPFHRLIARSMLAQALRV